MGWRHHTDPGPDGVVHVWPESDVREHVLVNGPCWCEAGVEFYPSGNVLVVHRDELDRCGIA